MIEVPVSAGELVDKITILEIKLERIEDSSKKKNIKVELDLLLDIYNRTIVPSADIRELEARLKSVNSRLWTIEDDIREFERRQDFGAGFVALARSVYRSNDERAGLKKLINEMLRSELVEEKSYTDY